MQKTQVETVHLKHAAALAELDKYKLLVESIQDYAIFLLDPQGYICTWNKGAQRTKGYTADEIIGQHFSTFYMERDKIAQKPERWLELAARLGKVECEDWRVRKDGSKFWADVVITALFNENGDLVGYAKVTRDLTERKQHEDMLRRANVLLRQQQRELQQLNAMKDEFISVASHQLRTPATAIKQYTGLILEGLLGEITPEQRSILKKIYDNNEHQLAIVHGLLEIAQLDSGNIHLQVAPTDIHSLLQTAVDDHQQTCNKRNQILKLVAPARLPQVMVDGHYFRMALDNLVDNASKYTPSGGKITVRARKEDTHLSITVTDTGVGIATEDIGRLFQKFSRIPNELSEEVGGSGLGLYWVQRVVALHEGTVSVTSTPGKGTVFTVKLPITN